MVGFINTPETKPVSQHANYQPAYSTASAFKPTLFISLKPASQTASLKPAFPLTSPKVVADQSQQAINLHSTVSEWSG